MTFVAARVPGQVSRVLVDDNNRVKQGDLLVELDKEPYEVIVAVKKAAVDTAKANAGDFSTPWRMSKVSAAPAGVVISKSTWPLILSGVAPHPCQARGLELGKAN